MNAEQKTKILLNFLTFPTK